MAFGGRWMEGKIVMLGKITQIWKEENILTYIFSHVDLWFNFYIVECMCVVGWGSSLN